MSYSRPADQSAASLPRADDPAAGSGAPGAQAGDPWTCAGRPGGYAWWYADLATERYALTVILFAGAVFSPRYAAAVRRGRSDTGLLYPAVNVSLHEIVGGRPRPLAWVMNEHPPEALSPLPGGLAVGGSRLSRQADGSVRIELVEETTRFFGRPGQVLRGEIVLFPERPEGPGLAPLRLSRAGVGGEDHFWQPRCVRARAAAHLVLGGRQISFSGLAYHDGNFGSGRLERAFARWSWAHGRMRSGPDGVVLYQVIGWDGGVRGLAVRQRAGEGLTVEGPLDLDPAPAQPEGPAVVDRLGLTVMPRPFAVGGLACEPLPGGALLSAPFYARYAARIRTPEGQDLDGVGEYLDLDRFRSPVLQFLLRYKTRRLPGASGRVLGWLGS